MVVVLSEVQFGLKTNTHLISEQIARHEVQFPLYYIHFEIGRKTHLPRSSKEQFSFKRAHVYSMFIQDVDKIMNLFMHKIFTK